jgi:RNA polymerase sigma factor (sigma-70 family)
MHDALERMQTAVAAGSGARARRALGDVRSDAERSKALDLLAGLAAEGSPVATELLLEAVDQFGVARSAVRRFLFDDHAVDDVVQDTMITIARSITSFRGEATFTTWLHRLARNRAVDHLRRARSTEPLGEHDRSATERMSSLIASRQSVQQLLELLPDRYREPVLLRDVEQLPYAEVAARLDANVNTVKSLVARGRTLVARLVEQAEGVAVDRAEPDAHLGPGARS